MNLLTNSSVVNLYQLAFFMLQPVAITLEDFAVYLGKKAGLKESSKIYLIFQRRTSKHSDLQGLRGPLGVGGPLHGSPTR